MDFLDKSLSGSATTIAQTREKKQATWRADEVKEYLRKHQLFPLQISGRVPPNLGLIVVIPCYDEPDPTSTLESLRANLRPPCFCEVLIVINDSEADDDQLRRRNGRSYAQVREWILEESAPGIAFHALRFSRLPSRHAGVGLARKLGMDEAVARLADSEEAGGIVVCLDADCRCEPNYLDSIYRHFEANPSSPGASIYFEHDLTGDSGPMTSYELFLRYYVEALRYSGFPHAFHTIGSCMAVRSGAYVRQGGMNRRQGGEDFYFLHKLTKLGELGEIRTTTVFPSSRPSTRVPFGTGRAVARIGDGSALTAYSPLTFRDLRALIDHVPALFRADPGNKQLMDSLPGSVAGFLADCQFSTKLAEFQQNTASEVSFRKRFFQWFNGFRALKYAHYAARHHYAREPVVEAAQTLLNWIVQARGPGIAEYDLHGLLREYRRRQKAL